MDGSALPLTTDKPVNQGVNGSDGERYTIGDHPLGEARPLRVICIGAGVTGLNLAYMLPKHIQNVEYVMYDKNPAIGGTWFENRYPGIACDIPAHIYQFSWAPNPDWSEFYASGAEILAYLQNVARKFDLEKYARLQQKVVGAYWDEDEGVWNLTIHNEVTGETGRDRCHFLINGTGFLNDWRWPEIKGLHSFKGSLMHSANWDPNAKLDGQRIGVIGNGSSGIQIVTALQPVAQHLTTFIRNPTWITTVYAQEFAGENGSNFKYTQEQKDEFRNNPEKYLAYRKAIETEMNGRFDISLKDSDFQKFAREYLAAQMRQRLGEQHPLASSLVPDFAVGCRRLTPGVGYLEALVSASTTVVMDPIESVEPEGVRLKTGELVELDALVCATGFNVSWAPRFPVVGRNGTDLQKAWNSSRASAYMALAVPDIPNYFLFLGPGSPLSHGSAIPTVEHETRYIIRMIFKAQTENYKAIVPLQAATEEFVAHMKEFNKRTVWSDNCSSWLRQGKEDTAPLCHPGSRIHWFHMLQEPRWEDWKWTSLSKDNRFAYLGNGFSTWEGEGKDISWYVDDGNVGLESIHFRNSTTTKALEK